MIRFLISAILALGLAACDQSKHPKKKSPFMPPAPKPAPAPDNSPSPTTSPSPTSPAIQTYSQFMFEQQRKSLAANALESDAGVVGRSSHSGSYSAMWCAPGVACRPHFVMVTSSAGTCSGVIVAPRVVLTNRHCVEDVVQEPNTSFSGSILVISPQSSPKKYDSETNYAVNLIAISPTKFVADEVKPDYAFLLLREPFKNVKPVKLNFDGIKDGEVYSIYGVSPFADAKDRNAVEKRDCVAKYNTTIAPNLDSPKDVNFKFGGCAIGPSNSGSPVFNKKDELVGLMGGQLSPRTVEALNIIALLEFHLIDPNNPLRHVGWGTNLACMPDIRDLSKPIPAECDRDYNSPKIFAIIPTQAENRMIDELGRLPRTEGDFNFGVMRAAESESTLKFVTQALYLRVPECIHATALKDKTGAQDVEMKIQTIGVALTRLWELTDKIVGPVEKDFRAHYDASDLKSRGFTDLTLYYKKEVKFQTTVLKICPK